jgi:hypothetical protein
VESPAREFRAPQELAERFRPERPPRPAEAAEVAGLYRGLRKGLEDTKNEPAAADFYYGEMEMRRRASHEVERGLLTLYWAVSGYGLRAWRAIAALLVLLAVSAALFTQPGFARIPQPPERITRVDPSTGNASSTPRRPPGAAPEQEPTSGGRWSSPPARASPLGVPLRSVSPGAK